MDSHTSEQSLQNEVFSFFPIFRKQTTCILLASLAFMISFNFTRIFQPQYLLYIGFPLKSSEIMSDRRNSDVKICDYSNGNWIYDENYMIGSYNEDCPFLDPGFRCRKNGRKDRNYLNWRWKPKDCNLSRFNATDMLERSRNRKIVFVGDSIGRNQWESLLCMLAQSISNKSNIYEQNGNPITKHKGFLSFKFRDYNLTIEYYRIPFLVTVARPPRNTSLKIQSVIRVDKLHWRSKQWVDADILVFNAVHWWNQDKTLKMGCYFQEGKAINMTMGVREAFWKSLQTWKKWVLHHSGSQKSHTFFMGFSPVHFKGGTWNDGGTCDHETSPGENYRGLKSELWNNQMIYDTIEQIKATKRGVVFLNISYMTEFRKDGHPSVHREPGLPKTTAVQQDCSHWCLPGVPDTWNQLLYSHLLLKNYR